MITSKELEIKEGPRAGESEASGIQLASIAVRGKTRWSLFINRRKQIITTVIMSIVPFDIVHLTDEMVYRAEKELGETEARRERYLNELRKKIAASKLRLCISDDTFLLMFLRVRKFNMERTMTNMEDMYQTIANFADVFSDTNYEDVKKLVRNKVFGILPYRAENGSMIFVIQTEKYQFDKMKFSIFIRVMAVVVVMIVGTNPATQVCGMNVIFDTKNTSVTNLRYVSLRHIYLVGKGLKSLIPARFKSIHFINAPTALRMSFNVVRSVLSEKLQQRLHFHSNTQQALLKYFHTSMLPKEYGGTYDYDNLLLINRLEQLEQLHTDIFASCIKSEKSDSSKK